MPELDLTILSKLRPATSKKTPRVSIVGQVFNRWTVYGLMGYTKNSLAMSYWLCRCQCGNWGIISKSHLKTNHSKSCGCWNNEVRGQSSITHGMTRTRPFRRWSDMLTRVNNPNTSCAVNYIERGITACEGMRKFETFYALLGDPPPKQELDRIDNEGNYSCGSCDECLSKNWPMNVRWADLKTQARNKRNNVFLTYGDKTLCVAEWAEILNLNPLLIAKRKRNGWPDEECLGFKHRASADRYRHNP